MLLALLKKNLLEIMFCFTYCKMNQRFILWRLLFCWYIQYDRYIYIEYVFYLYLMQYVNLMARTISDWLFTFSCKHEHRATRKLPQFLFRLAELTTFSFYANVSSSEDCQQEGILGNGSLWFCVAALTVLYPQCDYETLTNGQPTARIFTKFFWTRQSVNSVDAHLCWCREAFMWCLSG